MLKPNHVPCSGSCARCRAALDLTSVMSEGTWYCSPACARGDRAGQPPSSSGLPEERTCPSARRYFRKRRPIELL